MHATNDGYWRAVLEEIPEGASYWFQDHDDRRFPDPASRSQPQGVHGPSSLVDLNEFAWTDQNWQGRPLSEYVIYELHVGTFTKEGTLDAALEDLPRLAELGVTAVELMPVAAFPGRRNWGYDGVDLFAVHEAYGGPRALQRFVDAAHGHGLAVVLDVVYNHLGPEGNYLGPLGPYFTDTYHTPWGSAINLDGPYCDEVRRFFIENALMWLRDFHIDGLRLDAVHAFMDRSPRPFLAELSEAVEDLSQHGWPRFLIAESDANDPRLLAPVGAHGLGMDAVWADDFHHAVHAWLTGERRGYYEDYGEPGDIARAERAGFAYAGHYSRYRRRRHGAPASDLAPQCFVTCVQNHDQVGNRARGDRLSTLVGLEQQRLAAALLLTSTHTPLLFMGEEWGETAPFPYFTDHGDPELVDAVRKGRQGEFASHGWKEEPLDPQDPSTFERAKIDRALAERVGHRETHALYKSLLALRRTPAFLRGRAEADQLGQHGDGVLVYRLGRPAEIVAVFNVTSQTLQCELDLGSSVLRPVVDSGDPRFGGAGSIAAAAPARGTLDLALPAAGFVVFGPITQEPS